MRPSVVLASFVAASSSVGGWANAAQTYSLDGVALPSKISDVIASRGKPQRREGYKYVWENSDGGRTEVTTLANGIVVEVDVEGGPHEVRKVLLPALQPQTYAVLGQSGHANYSPPAGALESDLCEDLGLSGKPCASYTLPGWGVLVVNFGADVGLADRSLSEIILAAPGYLDRARSDVTPRPRQTFPGVALDARTQASVVVTVSGCGAQAIQKGPISISVWPANWYPGDGNEVALAETRNNAVFHLQPGYYRFMMGGYGCWEQMQWLALLPGHDRTATLHFESFAAKPNRDYFVAYDPSGGVAGTIPAGVSKIVFHPKTGTRPKPISVVINDGLYYADRVPEGSYLLRVYRGGTVATKSITVTRDRMLVADFIERDFGS